MISARDHLFSMGYENPARALCTTIVVHRPYHILTSLWRAILSCAWTHLKVRGMV